jgi:hypothetical protein
LGGGVCGGVGSGEKEEEGVEALAVARGSRRVRQGWRRRRQGGGGGYGGVVDGKEEEEGVEALAAVRRRGMCGRVGGGEEEEDGVLVARRRGMAWRG